MSKTEQDDNKSVKRALALWMGGGVKSKRDFTQVLNSLIEDGSLSYQARFFYIYLKARAGQRGVIALSNAEIKAAIGWDRKTVAGYRHELAASGLIAFTEPDARNKYAYYLFHPEDLPGYVPRDPPPSSPAQTVREPSETESASMNEIEDEWGPGQPPLDMSLLTDRMRDWALRHTPLLNPVSEMEVYQELHGLGDEDLPESRERWRDGWKRFMLRRQEEESAAAHPIGTGFTGLEESDFAEAHPDKRTFKGFEGLDDE